MKNWATTRAPPGFINEAKDKKDGGDVGGRWGDVIDVAGRKELRNSAKREVKGGDERDVGIRRIKRERRAPRTGYRDGEVVELGS